MNESSGFERIAPIGMALCLAGCSSAWSVDPVMLKQPLGASVRHTLVAQLYDPYAAAYPDPEPVRRFDGYRANNTLQGYRLTSGQATHLSVPNYSLSVGNVGGGGGGQ